MGRRPRSRKWLIPLFLIMVGGGLDILIIFWFTSAPERRPRPPQEARYPADLGLTQIDVTSYPAEQQRNYKVFTAQCAACHTLARAVNAPWSDGEKWQRYVQRRGAGYGADGKRRFTAKEAESLVSFLVYDSLRRKVENAAPFQAEQNDLKLKFVKVLEDRARMNTGKN